jgi:hypothetical protein
MRGDTVSCCVYFMPWTTCGEFQVSRRNPNGERRGQLVCSCGKPLDRFLADHPSGRLLLSTPRGSRRATFCPNGEWRYTWKCKRKGCGRSVRLRYSTLERGRCRAAADGRTDVLVGVDV